MVNFFLDSCLLEDVQLNLAIGGLAELRSRAMRKEGGNSLCSTNLIAVSLHTFLGGRENEK